MRIGKANGFSDRNVCRGMWNKGQNVCNETDFYYTRLCALLNYTAENAKENISSLYECFKDPWKEGLHFTRSRCQDAPVRSRPIHPASSYSNVSGLETHHTSNLLTLHITIYTRSWEKMSRTPNLHRKKNNNKKKPERRINKATLSPWFSKVTLF